VIAKYLKELLPKYDVKIGGTTSIDVTRRGVNKSYGIMKLAEQIKIPVKEMVFVGDAIFVGGNDHSAIVTGIDCIEVKDEKETEILIRESWL
jgi:hydroxymethylpyrimidine pyrophosphatase-like HAD family hydrolase